MALTIEDLLVREEITDVLKRLARGCDRLDAQMIESCYYPDAFDDHGMFKGSPAEFAATVIEVLPNFKSTMHFIASPNIRLDGNVAHVDTYCIAHHISDENDLIIGLRYIDRFERRDQQWLIAKRVCAFDWHYTVPFVPTTAFNFDDAFTYGQRNQTDLSYSGV